MEYYKDGMTMLEYRKLLREMNNEGYKQSSYDIAHHAVYVLGYEYSGCFCNPNYIKLYRKEVK